jgi:hypothetical protein
LKSINVGSFDFGGFRWVITTEGNATKNATNYVTNTSGTHQTTETFPAPNNSKTWGMCWNGTNFVTLTQNNRLYTHTAVAKSGTNVWYARSTFFDGDNSRTVSVSAVSGNGTTTTVTTSTSHLFVAGDTVYISGTGATALNNAYYTILTAPTGTTFTVSSSYSGSTGAAGSVTNEWETPMSGYAQSTVTRRAKLTISTSNIPVGAGSNQPDRARFYFRNTAPSSSTDTTNFFRQTNPNPSVSQVFTSSPTFSGTAAVQTAFPAGTPAKIVSNNGLLEISSDGFVRTDRLVLQSTRDANTSAGNTPALMVGTTSGIHLRIDGNEIIAMASDSAQGNLNVNPGGQVNIKDLNVTGSMVGTTTFASATVFNGANNDFPNIPSGGTANANLNTANSNRLRLISSARRFKTNIEPLELNEGHVEKILALEPRIYDRIDDETGDLTPEVGFIAEEAEELGLTPWVIYKDDEIFSFDYFKFSAVAHQGVLRQHHREIVELKAEVAALKARG